MTWEVKTHDFIHLTSLSFLDLFLQSSINLLNKKQLNPFVSGTDDIEVMQTQSQLSRCSQSNGEDRLINKMHYYRHKEPKRK